VNIVRETSRQQGAATIFVAMTLLILITLLVTTAYSISTINLKAVGNAQVRSEAIAAANKTLWLVSAETFWNITPWPAEPDSIDINNDGVPEYDVLVVEPTCVRATKAAIASTSSVTLPGFSAVDAWNTIWELDATATEASSGTRVRVRHGVRVLMTEADKKLYCDT
jgi:hypothetical protein